MPPKPHKRLKARVLSEHFDDAYSNIFTSDASTYHRQCIHEYFRAIFKEVMRSGPISRALREAVSLEIERIKRERKAELVETGAIQKQCYAERTTVDLILDADKVSDARVFLATNCWHQDDFLDALCCLVWKDTLYIDSDDVTVIIHYDKLRSENKHLSDKEWAEKIHHPYTKPIQLQCSVKFATDEGLAKLHFAIRSDSIDEAATALMEKGIIDRPENLSAQRLAAVLIEASVKDYDAFRKTVNKLYSDDCNVWLKKYDRLKRATKPDKDENGRRSIAATTTEGVKREFYILAMKSRFSHNDIMQYLMRSLRELSTEEILAFMPDSPKNYLESRMNAKLD